MLGLIGLGASAALWLAAPAVAACSGASCGTVALPYKLDFSTAAAGGLVDRAGAHSGFTIVDQPSRGAGYRPGLLELASGRLAIETTAGIAYRRENSLDNALGIGLAPRGSAFALRTTLTDIPAVAGGYAQAGLWFGTSEDNYVKLVVIAHPRHGTRVHMLRESAGQPFGLYDSVAIAPEGATVSLRLRVDPASAEVTGAYAVNGGGARQITTMSIPETLLYRGQDGGEPVATGGVFATHRRGPGPLRYSFDDFEAACVTPACTPGPAPPDPDFGDGQPPSGIPSEDGDPADPGTTPPATGPRATLTLPRRVRLSTLRRRGLRAALRCPTRCSFIGRLQLGPRGTRRLQPPGTRRAPLTVARTRGSTGPNRSKTLTVQPSKRTGRRLATTRARKLRTTMRLRVTLTPGTTQTIRRTVIVQR